MELVYKYLDSADTAYLLKKGTVVFKISDMDTFEFSGENIIFGAGEILVQEREGVQQYRSKDVYVKDGSVYEEFPKERLLNLFKNPKTAYAMTRIISKLLIRINGIFQKRSTELSQSSRLSQEYSKIFAKSCNVIKDEFSSKRYFWLEELYKKATSSLTYHRGKAFLQMDNKKPLTMKTEIAELDAVYHNGNYLCKQGDTSNEMFILREGEIEVKIGDNKVTEISKPNTVIGEIALLLGQKRSASLIAKGNVRVSVIDKNKVIDVIKHDPDFFINIATTHSDWECNNCILIREIDENLKLHEKEKDLPKFMKSENKCKEEVFELKKEIMALNEKYQMDFLCNIENIISCGLIELKHG